MKDGDFESNVPSFWSAYDPGVDAIFVNVGRLLRVGPLPLDKAVARRGVVVDTVLPFQFLNAAESSLGMGAGDAVAQELGPLCPGIVLGGDCHRGWRYGGLTCSMRARISVNLSTKKDKIFQLSEV